MVLDTASCHQNVSAGQEKLSDRPDSFRGEVAKWLRNQIIFQYPDLFRGPRVWSIECIEVWVWSVHCKRNGFHCWNSFHSSIQVSFVFPVKFILNLASSKRTNRALLGQESWPNPEQDSCLRSVMGHHCWLGAIRWYQVLSTNSELACRLLKRVNSALLIPSEIDKPLNLLNTHVDSSRTKHLKVVTHNLCRRRLNRINLKFKTKALPYGSLLFSK